MTKSGNANEYDNIGEPLKTKPSVVSKLLIDTYDLVSDSTEVTSTQSSPKAAEMDALHTCGGEALSEKHNFQNSEVKLDKKQEEIKCPIEVCEIQKGKKNEKKFLNKILSIDKDAFGPIDGQNFIIKQFWKSKENKIVVAHKNMKTFCGYACYLTQKDGSCYLMRIAVKESHQRNGIGRLLMNKLMADFDGKLELEVAEDNTKAVNFYLRNGLRIKEEFTTQDGVKFFKFSSNDE